MDKYQTLKKLVEGAVERLILLPQPIVRVSGPITSGGVGSYEENLSRFIKAQDILRQKGLTVFDYFEGHNDEEVIKSLGLPWKEVIDLYHRPILAAGLIKTACFMPDWQSSNGAKDEYNIAKEFGIEIKDFPEEWLVE